MTIDEYPAHFLCAWTYKFGKGYNDPTKTAIVGISDTYLAVYLASLLHAQRFVQPGLTCFFGLQNKGGGAEAYWYVYGYRATD